MNFLKYLIMKKTIVFILFLSMFSVNVFSKTVRLLAIGNSFSEDGIENYLYDLVQANGDTIIIGNMYIGGCSLEMHYKNMLADSPHYNYRKIVDGVKTKSPKFSLKDALQDEAWDFISFQQVSSHSGVYESYFPYISELIDYSRKFSKKNDFQLILHMTWAYAKDSSHEGFKTYHKNQLEMYYAIISTVQKIANSIKADIIIPTGTAIQNGRTSLLGDTYCRDGYHLELNFGRYTAACVWLESLFGVSAIGSKFNPSNIDKTQLKIAQYAAHYAVKYPFSITDLTRLK